MLISQHVLAPGYIHPGLGM